MTEAQPSEPSHEAHSSSRVRLGIIFGGTGEEHPISVKSAREVAASLDADAYEPFWIGITLDGRWLLTADGPTEGWEHNARAVALSPDRTTHGLLVLDGDPVERIRLDVILPVIHGAFGEDGSIQGLLELSGIPYVGCGIAASAVCMDKALAYTVVRAAGIPTPEFRIVYGDDEVDADSIDYPVFVKPARSGSSFGVTKVDGPDALPAAIADAGQFDSKVLIEGAVAGREIGCSILGSGSDLTTGELDRVAVTSGIFRIHQEASPETGSENSAFIVPADITDDERRRVLDTAKAIYQALGCSGIARVDTFLADDGRVILNEVNTLPGLTSYSRYPRMMAAAGLSLGEVVDRLVSHALHEQRR